MSTSLSPAEGEHRYARVNVSKPREYWDYEALKVQWNSPDRYEVIKCIGRGKYCNAFLAYDIVQLRKVVIKVLKPVRKKKVLREIKVLQALNGGLNIVELYDTVCDPNSKTPSLVLEYVDAADFRTLFPHFSDIDARHFIFQVLLALEYAHSRGIMHRDIKPTNVCLDYKRRELKVIDWGLAEFFHPETTYNVRVASRYFKGPELLVEYSMYDYRLDMWSLGCMMAGIIFMKEPFFRGKNNNDQLVRIVKVLGTDDLQEYLVKYNLKLPSALQVSFGKHTKKPWSMFVTPQNQHLCPAEALHFLDCLLQYDHTRRSQAAEALQHPYFDLVRPKENPYSISSPKEKTDVN